MTLAGTFDDPRGRTSEEIAFQAERTEHAGDIEEARRLFAQAAELEEAVARDADLAAPRVRSVLFVSAVWLWVRADRRDRAELLARYYLDQPAIDAEARQALQSFATP